MLEASPDPVEKFLVHNPEFEEVSPQLVQQSSWKLGHVTPMSDAEPIHIKEMRGLMAVVRRRVRNQSCWDQRLLVLGDNLGLMSALSKGRCQNPQLLMLMRRASAALLASGCRIYGRWVCSELNPSDGPSRIFEARRASHARGCGSVVALAPSPPPAGELRRGASAPCADSPLRFRRDARGD